MQYYVKDFTEKNYEKLLQLIKNETIFYNKIDTKDRYTLWRHDKYLCKILKKKCSVL